MLVKKLITISYYKGNVLKKYLIMLLLVACGSKFGKYDDCGTNCPSGPVSNEIVEPVENNPSNPAGLGPAAVSLSITGGEAAPGDLASAGNYVILAKSAVSDTSGSTIVGNIGLSPAAESYITNFALVRDGSNEFSTAVNVAGKIYAADLTSPTPANLTSAVSNMETAYIDAAGRTSPDYTELAAGSVGGLTLSPGLYKWSSDVGIPTTLVFSGSANDVWILQIAGNVDLSNGIAILLSGGAQAKNIFWQVAGQTTIGTNSHFEGIILCQTAVVMNTNSTLNGRIYAQTAVTLDSSDVIEP